MFVHQLRATSLQLMPVKVHLPVHDVQLATLYMQRLKLMMHDVQVVSLCIRS